MNKNYRKKYVEKVYKEFEKKGLDFNKIVGRYKLETIINKNSAYEVFKERVINERKKYNERKRIHSEYLEIQKKSIQRGKEIREKQQRKYDDRLIKKAEKKGVINRQGIKLNTNQVKQLKNIFISHRELYDTFKNKLIKDFGFNNDDIALLEGEILQSDRGNTFQLPINVKGFESFKNLIDSFTLQNNVDNLIKIYKKDIESLETSKLTLQDRIEGKDFEELFEDLLRDKVITVAEYEDLKYMIEHTRFTTKEAIRNHFGKLSNMIDSDPKTGVRIVNYHRTLRNWITLFDKANYIVRR